MTATARSTSAFARSDISAPLPQHHQQADRPAMPQPWAGDRPADELHALVRALEAITDLITPHGGSLGLAGVGRDQFSGLLQLLVRIQTEGSELAEEYAADCYSAIADLSIPESDMHCVNREHLASLLYVIQSMQKDALGRLFKEQEEARKGDHA